MICQNCHKNYSIIVIKEIVDGVQKDIFLCESCALDRGFTDILYNAKLKIENFITTLLEKDKELIALAQKSSICVCGYSIDDFMKTGVLSCPKCFDTFENVLTEIYGKVFGASKHYGKMPHKYTHKIEMLKKIEKYKQELEIVIKNEDYERAAQLRDKINELKSKID